MKVLLVGNGAREHCIGEALTRGKGADLFVYGNKRNPGLLESAERYEVGDLLDFASLLDFARKVKPDFAVIGPDDPIAAGAADALLEAGIESVAPLKTVARLESSKSFTRDLLAKYGIAGNPKFRVFLSSDGMREFIEKLGGNYVVKADGLTGGKGVKVSGDHLQTVDEGLRYANECLAASGRVVVEEKLIGQEFSLMSFVDGEHVVDMPPIQDHKRAFENDVGPNTGGMGSYSDANGLLPFLTRKDLDDAHEITASVAEALHRETGTLFKGVMYGGFIAVEDGVRLIEYNARFGDPEAMNALPILKTDFLEICDGILRGTLDRAKIEFEKKATVCKYVVPEGYPGGAKKGEKIEAPKIDNATSSTKMYYASVDQKEDGLYLSSSRALAFVGIADTLERAEEMAQGEIEKVKGPVFYRKDIGTRALVEKRVEMMRGLRGAATDTRLLIE